MISANCFPHFQIYPIKNQACPAPTPPRHVCGESWFLPNKNNESWAKFSLSRSEWKLIEGAVKCLKPVKLMIKNREGEKEPTIDKVIAEIFNVQTTLRKFVENPDNCGYGITFAKELKKQIEIRFPDKGTDRVQRRMANYLSPRLRGAHLDMYGKMESTKKEIEEKIKTYEDIPEVDNTEHPVNDASHSPNSKLVKMHMEKMRRERTREGDENNQVRKEMETGEV